MQRKFKSIILFIGVLLSIASILMLFLPAATIENFNLTGWEIVFGTIEIENDSESFGISVAGIFLILLLILGFLFLIASWRQKIAKNDKAAKVLGILSSVFSATSGILFFFLKDTGALAELNVFDIGIGSILGGIAAILSAICSAVAALSSDLSDKSEKPIQKERHIIKQFKEKNGRSLLAIITDDKNNEELTLVDECGKEYKFEQLWYKPYRNATYCILTEINEVQPDQKETYIFFFVKKGTELVLQQEFDERNCQQVLKDYSEYKKQKHLNTKQQAEMHKADSQDNRTKF